MRAPRRTARLRLTILYGGVCLVFGAILLAVTYLLTWGAISTNLHAYPMAVSSQGAASVAAAQANQDRSQNGVAQQITLDRQLLRTPLTRERTLLQVTLADPASTADTWQAVGKELLASNAETERLIEALLTLASGEAGLGERGPVDLAAITGAALAAPRAEIGRLGLSVRTDLKPAILQGDPLLVQQLVTNLIDNAVRHNVPGGEVQVATATSGGRAVLSVINSGQAIPPGEVDRLFQPFQRLGPRRARRDGGHGLGLSIVGAIATAHHATITPRSGPGGGLAIAVAFP